MDIATCLDLFQSSVDLRLDNQIKALKESDLILDPPLYQFMHHPLIPHIYEHRSSDAHAHTNKDTVIYLAPITHHFSSLYLTLIAYTIKSHW